MKKICAKRKKNPRFLLRKPVKLVYFKPGFALIKCQLSSLNCLSHLEQENGCSFLFNYLVKSMHLHMVRKCRMPFHIGSKEHAYSYVNYHFHLIRSFIEVLSHTGEKHFPLHQMWQKVWAQISLHISSRQMVFSIWYISCIQMW